MPKEPVARGKGEGGRGERRWGGGGKITRECKKKLREGGVIRSSVT